jgi:hypothetical protein
MADSNTDWGDILKLGGDALGRFGNAAGDLLGAQASTNSAAGFRKAAGFATENADLELASARIQQIQQQRQIQKTIGAAQAEIGGAGFTDSGSSLDILASSAQQGALTTALTGVQGQITANGYIQQAQAYNAQAQAAEDAAKAKKGGGFLSALGGIADVAQIAMKFF